VTVVDASVVADLLLGRPTADAGAALAGLLRRGEALAAPDLLDVEVAQVLRRFVRGGALAPRDAAAALEDLRALSIDRYPGAGLVGRAFALREDVTVHDGVYLALAEALGRPFLTADAGLAAVPGCDAEVQVVAAG
jgi:predicted nucleic acid-binding protein